jgi:4-amino-4-deoxy-L-arabinose transferase-like glycosyltransferase
MKNWQIVLIIMAIQAGFVVGLQAEFLTDWDSYLYTFGGMNFEPISLASGRWLLTGLLGVVWRIVNDVTRVSPDSAWEVFSWTTMAFAVLNAGMFFSLCRRWSDRNGAIVATAIFISSPMVGVYGSAVMTETYAMTCLLGSLLLLTGGMTTLWRVALAGLIFGAGCTIREPMVLLGVVPVWLMVRQEMATSRRVVGISIFAGMAILAIGLNFWLVWSFADNWGEIYKSWSMGMARERMQMGHTAWKMVLRNLLCLAVWLLVFSPIVVLTIPDQIKTLGKKKMIWAVPVLAGILVYCMGQVANHSLIFNPRFVIFVGALLCLPAGLAIWERMPEKLRNPYGIAAAVIVVHLAGLSMFWSGLDSYYYEKSRSAKEVYQTLDGAAESAVFVPGKLTPVVEFYRQVHPRQWRIMYGGWDFSDKEVSQAIEQARLDGRAVYVVEERYWAEKSYRQMQYLTLENVWNRYPHHASSVSHFHRLTFPKERTPKDMMRRVMEFLFS